jgi:RND superfamily putative drug exporter
VQRIACWSARHRKTVVLGWCGLAGAAFLAGQVLGMQSLPQYDPGQAGRAEQIMHELDVVTPSAERVLIQARGSAAARLTFATDPQMQQAARQVTAALRALQVAAADVSSPGPADTGSKTAADPPGGGASGASGSAAGLVSAGGGSVLVTFRVAGPHADADATVAADQAAVARVQAAHPDLIVAEAGGASTDAAANALLASDFRMAELTLVPVTLILLLWCSVRWSPRASRCCWQAAR